jgi:hypothetical protein
MIIFYSNQQLSNYVPHCVQICHSYDPYTELNEENYNESSLNMIIFYSNQQLSNYVPHCVQICHSYDPYTELNEENYNESSLNMIIFYSNQQLSNYVPHCVQICHSYDPYTKLNEENLYIYIFQIVLHNKSVSHYFVATVRIGYSARLSSMQQSSHSCLVHLSQQPSQSTP